MKVYTLANTKGGVAKTTTAAALAYIAASQGKNTLAIDYDPQASLTNLLAGTPSQDEGALAFTKGASLRDCVQIVNDNLALLPAAFNLATLGEDPGELGELDRQIKQYCRGFDFVFIDTPASTNFLQFAAMRAADGLIIPMQAEINNLQSFYQTLETAHRIQQAAGRPKIKGIIITQQDDRVKVIRQLKEQIITIANDRGIKCLGVIPQGKAIKEAAALQADITKALKREKPVKAYFEVYKALTAQQVQ